MIKKFQQGNQIQQLAVEVVQGIAQELQADPQQVAQAAQQNPEALEAAMQVYAQTKDIKQTAQTFLQTIQQKTQQKKTKEKETQVAKHGAKLNYIKSLKHQCAENEELYYFKKGGSVGCGCRKKEDGGEVTKASKGCSAIKKFKAERGNKVPEINPNDTIHINGQVKSLTGKNIKDGNKEYKNLTKEEYRKLKLKDKQRVSEKDIESGRTPESKCGSKLKKHFNGGSLNRIPFYQSGTSKEGVRSSTYVAPISETGSTVTLPPYEKFSLWDLVPIVGTYRDAARMDYNPTVENKLRFGVSALADILGGRAAKLFEFPSAIGHVYGHFASQAERIPEPFWANSIDKRIVKRKKKDKEKEKKK